MTSSYHGLRVLMTPGDLTMRVADRAGMRPGLWMGSRA